MQKKQKRSKVNQLIGELVLCAPALILCSFIDLWFACILVILTLLVFKRGYKYGLHTSKSWVCILLSYLVIFVGCCLAYLFKGQYILIVILSSILAYFNDKLGHMQYKASRFDVIEKPYVELKALYDKQTQFNVKTCSEAELIAQCKVKGLSRSQIDFCIDAFINFNGKELWDKYGGEFQTVANKKQYYRKILMDNRKIKE